MKDADARRPRLRIELVPQPLWGKNLAHTLSRSRWQDLRAWGLRRAGDACEVCGFCSLGGKGLICHEVWAYDDVQSIQTLTGVEIHCVDCDRVTHYGRTSKVAGPDSALEALARLARLNNWSDAQARTHAKEAGQQWQARSRREWQQDTSWYDRWLTGGVQETLL